MPKDKKSKRASMVPRPWSLIVAVVVASFWIACLLLGAIQIAEGEQSPIESYLLTGAISSLSIAAGWIGTVIADQIKYGERSLNEIHKQDLIDASAESAVQRLFASLAALGRIQEVAASDAEGTAPARLRIAGEHASTAFINVSHSVDDWKRLSPTPVESAMKDAAKRREYKLNESTEDVRHLSEGAEQ